MATFEEFGVLLVLYYNAKLISDEDFLLLNELFPSKSPNFPYEEYSRFNLDNMSETECKAAFRFNKDGLPVPAEALQIRPPSFELNYVTYQRKDAIRSLFICRASPRYVPS